MCVSLSYAYLSFFFINHTLYGAYHKKKVLCLNYLHMTLQEVIHFYLSLKLAINYRQVETWVTFSFYLFFSSLAPVGNNTNGQYLQWAHDIGNAYCHGGFSYSNGDLVVPRDGLYSVYLQITYSGLVCPVHKKLMNKVLHSSEEYRNDMTLLSSIHTMSCSEDVWSKSLYTAGFFFLKAKDKLRVMSSHPDYITKAEYEVFFGAVLFPH